MENTTQPFGTQLDQNMEDMPSPNDQMDQPTKSITSKNKQLIPLILGLLLVVSVVGAYLLSQNSQAAPPDQTSPASMDAGSGVSENDDAMLVEPTEVAVQKVASDSDREATLSPTLAQTENDYPVGWKAHVFPEVSVTLAAPTQWQTDYQFFSSNNSHLIRLWQGASADTATIQLDLKPNWDNTGNAQYLTKDIALKNGIMAAKVDPPKMNETTLDRYQTNYYFEANERVYVFSCVHNWIDEQYQLCETMLKTGSFK